MTKEQAIEAMNAGQRVTHLYFSPDEYIYIMNGEIMDENGYRMRGNGFDFWTDRTGPEWQTDWSIF